MLAFIPALAFLLPVLAQGTSNGTASDVDIEGLEANFQQAQIVPGLLETFTPEGILSVEFAGQAITTGQNLTADDVSSSPTLAVSPASNATLDSSALYTVVMVDADIVGTDESSTQQTRHWLVNSAGIESGSSGSQAVNWTGSTSITDYAGPGPDAGSGAHRYVIIIYEQPSDFTAPDDLSTPGTALGQFSLSDYVSSSNLGSIVTANYFQVENGVATVSPSSTTAVESSTLAGYGSTTVSSSASGTVANSGAASDASATGSSTDSSSSSSSSAASSAAGVNTQVGWGMVVGAVGVVGAVVGAGMV
ncbi:nuclear protein [Cryptococcus wingfieldii CBS 7118]|uniref:Nuclear protein n=1 Tax=Cryptococcus wingfieldii CBS 7118 TaxID=1295528 RepID=A0A1E3JLV9_9TREE|nr:nuclear protein [Cryptococcus wingfieldii CBS 7118]ODO01793.1 nuclear protein [Cryptococcus wingfieldii CBS 7118]